MANFFKAVDLAVQLPDPNGTTNKAFMVLIRCGFGSMTQVEVAGGCSGTNLDVLLEGPGLRDASNLNKLKTVLNDVLTHVDELRSPAP